MQMPQIIWDGQYALHDIKSKLLTQHPRKALQFAGATSRLTNKLRGNKIVDTFRALAQYQDDISASDLASATFSYEGPPEGVDILLAHSSLHFERFDIAESIDTAPPLAVALRCYSRTFFFENSSRLNNNLCVPQAAYLSERKQWESLVKRFILKGADLHVPVPRKDYGPSNYFPFQVSEYGTPLDVLFQFSETPEEARTIGDEWLGLLASKGHDVVAYLKEEMALRAPEHQMTYPTPYISKELPLALRELQFTFDDAGPCVWWDWWIDPTSDVDLLEREFKQMVKHTCVLAGEFFPFLIDTWPFQYPVWYDNPEKLAQDWLGKGMEPAERRRRAHFAMQRANRRLEKRDAKNKYSKGSRYSQMPGAWPASCWD